MGAVQVCVQCERIYNRNAYPTWFYSHYRVLSNLVVFLINHLCLTPEGVGSNSACGNMSDVFRVCPGMAIAVDRYEMLCPIDNRKRFVFFLTKGNF